MAMEKFIGIGVARKADIFKKVLAILESEQPSVLALDDNPIAFSPLIQMRCSAELCNENFIMDQKKHLLKRELEVGTLAGALYAMRHGRIPVYLVDGSFNEPLSATGQEIGIYPYYTDMGFASSMDMMKTPITLRKERIPTYAGWDFEYDLIHAYQVNARFEDMDKALWQRNAFTAQVLMKIIHSRDKGTLAFIGDRKRYSLDAYRDTPGLSAHELSNYRPLTELLEVKELVVYDTIDDQSITRQ
jgi:hypothetical protein